MVFRPLKVSPKSRESAHWRTSKIQILNSLTKVLEDVGARAKAAENGGDLRAFSLLVEMLVVLVEKLVGAFGAKAWCWCFWWSSNRD